MKQQNYEQDKIAELLAVPRYADLLEDDMDMDKDGQEVSEPRLGLVRSHEG
jgi:hypothetical protein